MVEDVKKRKRIRSWWLLTVIVGLVVMAAVIWVAFFMNRSYDNDARAYVDGRIETGSNAVDQAVSELDGSEPADVIRDGGSSDEKRVALVFTGMTDEADTNNAILDMLSENGIKASFALSASEVLSETDFTDAVLDSGCELISNGTDGESNIHKKSTYDMVEIMQKSHESISTSADVAVPLIYCSSTKMTSDVLRAATVGGYEAVLDPEAAHVIDENSFKAESDASLFVDTLSGDTIVAADLRGTDEEIADESAVTAEKPAVDKQSDVESTDVQQEERPSVLMQVKWLIDAINNDGIAAEYVSSFQRTDGSEFLRERMNDADCEYAVVWRYALTDQNEAGLGMRGMPEGSELDELLSALKKNKTKMTFFLTADELHSRSDDIARVEDAGCTVGATGDVEGLTRDQVYDIVQESSAALRSYTDGPRLYLTDDYNLAAVRAAAQLLGVRVIKPDTPEAPFAGAFYMIGDTEKTDISALNKELKNNGLHMTDIQSVVNDAGSISVLSTNDLNAARRKNDHKLADVQNMVYTTERAVGFGFYGISNRTVSIDVANRLSAHGGRGTFFVTLDELMSGSSVIEHVIESGDEIGILYRESADYPQTFSSVINYINNWKIYAQWRYNVDSNVIFMPYDKPEADLEEAVSATGCKLVKSTFSVVNNDDKNCTLDDVETIMDRIADQRVTRGSFICFNMNFYVNDNDADEGNTILGNVLESYMSEHIDSLAYRSYISDQIEDESRFAVTTVSDILNSKKKYSLCTEKQTDIAMRKNVLSNMKSEEERFNYISEHYIGTSFVTSKRKLPGFTNDEIRKMDTSGRFTSDKILFLTFDDWGTEKSLNELLYILQKYDVKATFFVTTQHVDSNPNLLRTIAEQGHQIACHTDGHLPLSNSVEGRKNVAVTLTDDEASDLRQDLVNAYDKLYKYVGDVVVDGKKSLSKMFRPPTLAVSKIGISEVFDVGYTYSISGDMSTNDYKAVSYSDMVSQLKYGITDGGDHISVRDGSIIVMHMQENAKYTAQALDTMIPVWEQEGYRFARIDDYLSN